MVETLYYYIFFLPIALEGFPISSSGHVVLLTTMLSYFNCLPQVQFFPESIDHILHGPVAVIIVCFFYKRWFFFLRKIRRCFGVFMQLILFVIITTAITAFGYFFLHDMSLHIFPLYWGYLITTGALFSLRYCPRLVRSTQYVLDPRKAFVLGIAQAAALLPGISRFGVTFVIGRWLGFSSRRAFEISFFIELPISIAGFVKGLCSLAAGESTFYLLQMKFLCSMMIASYLGLCGFYIVYTLVVRNRVWLFGYYTAFLALLSWIFNN